MINEQKNNKLDETIKQSLSDYEAPFDANDWAKMESTLDAAPKASTFKWSYVIGTFVALAVLSGGYLVYNNWNSFKTNTPTTTQPIENTTPPAVTTTPPIVPPTVTKTEPVPQTKIETPVVVDETANKTKVSNTEKTLKEENVLTEKAKKKKTKDDIQKDNESNKQQIIIMGNEPIFGDMLDSSKGIIRVTKEKEETKQAAKKPAEYPIGWNNFMLSNVNPDSIRKYRESMKNDSLKK